MVSHPKHIGIVAGPLLELAQLYGVETFYRDWRGRWRDASADSVAHVLRALGADFDAPTEAAIERAILHRRRELWERIVEPVIVAWDGAWPTVALRLPNAQDGPRWSDRRVALELLLESGVTLRRTIDVDQLPLTAEALSSRDWFQVFDLPLHLLTSGGSGMKGESHEALGGRLPLGYHRLRVEIGSLTAESTVVSAPRRAWSPRATAAIRTSSRAPTVALGGVSEAMPSNFPRPWGVFAPVYALRSQRQWGAGDLADFGKLQGWVGDLGGEVVATLPLLAAYLDAPFEPTPYRPVSRLFWNEFYLAADQISEWERCAPARELWGSASTRVELSRLREEPLVDYRAVMSLKRRVLEELAHCFFSGADAGRREAFAAYQRDHPEAEKYASFRARVEAEGDDWRSWRDGRTGSMANEGRCHLYCQWQMEEQLTRLARRWGSGEIDSPAFDREQPGAGLFLDLPLGVHPGGFDIWRWPELFVEGISAGAPPDSFFALGQDWHLPPLHPERIREQGHQYFRACLRHHMRYARYLRIDHLMSLHRLFWVADEVEPANGVYVTYPADEMYAVLCLESQRNQTVVVGEDLGTIPVGVRSSMRRHRVLRTWAFQTSARPWAAVPVSPVPRHAVAGLNTHDMFPFAGFLRGQDIIARAETGQLDREGASREMAARRRLVARLAELLPPVVAEAGAPPRDLELELTAGRAESTSAELLFRALTYLATSQADLVLVNLEDMLAETRPQNLPGTGGDCGNWQRKAAGSEADAQQAIAVAAEVLAARGKQ